MEHSESAGTPVGLPGALVYFRGAFVPLEQARVPITTHAFNYGTGCFEGIRAYWNAAEGQLYVLRLVDHVERLLHSSSILKLDFDGDADHIAAVLIELLARNTFR